MGQRRVGFLGFLIDEHRVALGEGAATAILAAETNEAAFRQDRAEGERLGGGPIDPLARIEHRLSRIDEAVELGIQIEAVRDGDERPADRVERLAGDGGLAAALFQRRRGGDLRPFPLQPVGLVGLVALGGLERVLQPLPAVLGHTFHFVRGEQALLDQPLAVHGGDGGMVGDRLVHHRLGERGLVGFVVSEAAVGPDIENHILPEGVAELGRDARDVDHGFHVVAVDVEDRRLNRFRDLGRVARGPRRRRAGGEADLVVDDKVDGSAGAVTGDVRQAEGLRHDPLPGEGRIPMHQDAEDAPAFEILALALLGADLADDDGIDRLEMGRVGGQREMHLDAVELAVGGRAQMVLHVARAADLLGLVGHAPELGEDRRIGLVHDMGEHVEPSAMGHAEHDFLDAELGAALEDLFQAGISDSLPSRPKRLVPGYRTWRNFSKDSASTRRS